MDTLLLLSLLEEVLGKATHKNGDNYAFYCPCCKHYKKKLEISLIPKVHKGIAYQNSYQCWTCDLAGTNMYSLFKKIDAGKEYKAQLKSILPKTYYAVEKPKQTIFLPDEYRFIGDYDNLTSLEQSTAEACVKYLKSRGVNLNQIYRYGIGFASTGNYAHRIIIPSYDRYNNLNYFISRKNNDKNPDVMTYLKPIGISNDIIPFESTIDFSQPIRLVEGVFDMFASRYNTIPLLGLGISETLEYELITGDVKDIYLMLDSDALKSVVKYLNYYSSFGKTVYHVDIRDKDPSKLGFIKIGELIDNSSSFNFVQRMRLNAKAKYQTVGLF